MWGLNKLRFLPWYVVVAMTTLVAIGIIVLYSAANGHFDPWASKQFSRFCVGFFIMLAIARGDPRFWYQYAYVVYGITLLLLIVVELIGFIGMGAQRWINLYFFQFQPSEMMKIALVLSLARYFHNVYPQHLNYPRTLIFPLLMILIPVALVLRQPDLGTAIMLLGLGGTILFAAGIHYGYFVAAFGSILGIIPIAWHFLHQYQRNRVLNFLNPEHDPLNTGYQILQSKIALGSGGFWGRGFLKGTQSHLNFLPAKQTDFIFTTLCEEWGMMGGLVLIGLYFILIFYGYSLALTTRGCFGRLLVTGITMTLFFYMFINMAMVMGLVPVVGIPLPFITYGGTSLLSLMFGLGLVFSVDLQSRLLKNA